MEMSKVRAAFTADAELRLFAIGGGASEQVAQALANLLQVKVVAFTDARIQFRIEVIAETGPDDKPVLSKRILATPRFSSGPPFVFNNFDEMVSADAAKTGRLEVQPRRP